MSHFGDGSQFGTKIDYVNQSNLSGTLDALSLGLQNLEKDFINTNEVVLEKESVTTARVIWEDGREYYKNKLLIILKDFLSKKQQ